MTQSNKYYMSFRVIEHYVMDIGRPTGSPLRISWEIVLRALRVFVVEKKLPQIGVLGGKEKTSVSLCLCGEIKRATRPLAPTHFTENRS